MTALLEVKNVTKVFGGDGLFRKSAFNVALDNFSLKIPNEPPSFTAVAGESGSGKSTLANLILGFLTPSEGQILYKGRDLSKLSKAETLQFRREVQAIFQDPFAVYNPFYKVDHMLTVPIEKFRLAKSKAEANTLIHEALFKVGLRPEDTLGRYPHQLSGGQRQRVTIARALLLQPELIIADEPVSMVDASLRATILENLRTLHREFGISFLYITHDLTTAYQMSDQIIVLYRGIVAEIGHVEQVIKAPEHPYTRELVASVPNPNPDHQWGGETVLSVADNVIPASGSHGCKFAERCPHVMPECHQAPPPFYATHPNRAVTCYLYKDAPALSSAESMSLLMPASKMPE